MAQLCVGDAIIPTLCKRARKKGYATPPAQIEQPFKYVSSLITLDSGEEADVVTSAFFCRPFLFVQMSKEERRSKRAFACQEDRVFLKFGLEQGLSLGVISGLHIHWVRCTEIPDWFYFYCSAAIKFGNR